MFNPDHQCTSCDYKLCVDGSEIFDDLENVWRCLFNYIKMVLVYIAEYITRKDNQPRKCETHFYYKKYGKYTNFTERGKVKLPSHHICLWLLFFCFILVHTIKEKICYEPLINIFMLFTEFHFFNMEKKYASIFPSIILKFFCEHGTSRPEKVSARNILKLS